MSKLSIRARLLLFTSTLLTLLVLSNLYLRQQVLSSNHVLQIQIESGNSLLRQQFTTNNQSLAALEETVDQLRTIGRVLKAFGEVKHWLTDLQSSWLMESESNARVAAEQLKRLLKTLAPQFPQQVIAIQQHVDRFTVSALKAVDAYIGGNRVLGNSLLGNTRSSIVAVDALLTQLHHKIRQASLALNEKIRREQFIANQRLSAQGEQARQEAVAAYETATTISDSMLLGAALAAIVFTWLILLSINGPLGQITRALKSLAQGHLTVEVPAREREDEIGTMAQAAQVFKEALQKTVAQNWVQANVADITSAIQHTNSLSDAAQEIISRLVPLLHCGHGVFYLFDETEQRLELLASYAYNERKKLSNRFALGQGLAGQCALEQKTITLHQVPDDYIRIFSGLGEAKPDTLVAIPLLLQEELRGVIEIAAFQPFSANQQALLDELTPIIALYIDNLRRTVKTEKLLEQTQSQTEALKVSEEELKLREEELKASNEELRQQADLLQRQTAELQASEEELKTQQEELRTTNEELMEKTEALQEQQQTLQAAREKAK